MGWTRWNAGRTMKYALRGLCWLAVSSAAAFASEYRGLVTFGGLPVPGATVTVVQGSKKFVTVTDSQGFYSLPALADGAATVQLQMTGFAAVEEGVTIAAEGAPGRWELKLMSLEEMRTALKPVPSAAITVAQERAEPKKTSETPRPAEGQAAAPPPTPATEETTQRAADGLLINGSVNNAATSQFSLAGRFGNTASGRSKYSFSLNLSVGNSAFDARSYSLSGFNSPKPEQSRVSEGFAVQGPLKIPHLLKNGPNMFIQYQRTRNSNAVTTPGLVPTAAQRSGNFSQTVDSLGQTIYAPTTGLSAACLGAGVTPGAPFAANIIPQACISSAARALLNLYPTPNFAGNARYNFQLPLITDTHQDALNSNASKTIGRKDQLTGTFASMSTRASYTTLFGFVDATRGLGLNSSVTWAHTFNAHVRGNLGYQFSRQSNRTTPYWAGRSNISGAAGIPSGDAGNNQEPANWGPPTLNFSGALTSLTDANSSFIRSETNAVTVRMTWNRGPHNVTGGLEFRRQEFNYLSQANPRGTFGFTGAATSGGVTGGGSDLAGFLLGLPATSQIAFGNADKYLRQSAAALYLTDDWRVSPQLTLNVGARWEYEAPVTELKQRLVNLDVAPGFTDVRPVVASSPKGVLTGQSYPESLMRRDLAGIQPRLGLSWRPIPGSSLLVSAGYGMNYDTSVYRGIAIQMAQQSPFSKSLTAQSSAACPLTLINGFNTCATAATNTFGVDPNYRVGYVHTWNLKMQRDLPGSLQMVATYLGIKGTRGAQLFLPNTVPAGGVNPCPSCPNGFEYLASNGNSTRESGQLQLRRRLRSGFTASVLYTYSKSIDNDSALGGQGAATAASATIAQDWRNLRGERGLSTFDQRHLANFQLQYTTGMGKGGGTLLSGWRGRAYKEWTVQTQLNVGSGLPLTPLDSAVAVAGYTAFVRPNLTGAPLTIGGRPNPAAYMSPAAGQWGSARRNSITGPNQFSLNANLVRTFRVTSKLNMDAQIAATNPLNRVTFTNWYTSISSTLFGTPAAVNPQRSLQVSLRLRF